MNIVFRVCRSLQNPKSIALRAAKRTGALASANQHNSRRFKGKPTALFILKIMTIQEQILDWENLLLAWKLVRKNHRKSRQVIRFEKNLSLNLYELRIALESMEWTPGPYRTFIVNEPKERLIAAPSLSNRIVQQMWVNLFNQKFEDTFIEHSYACRVGKGMLKGCLDLQASMRNLPRKEEWYVCKLDYRKYFHSISHEVIKEIIRKTVKDRWAVWIIDSIIDSYDPGLPIGSLTSQLMANIVLNEVDHFAMDVLGIKKYGRYMDDLYFLGNDREVLEKQMDLIARYSFEKLELDVNGRKCKIVSFKKPFEKAEAIDFCGFRVMTDKLFVRKTTLKRASRRIQAVTNRARSNPGLLDYLGYQLTSLNGLLAHTEEDSYTRLLLRTTVREARELIRKEEPYATL